MASKLVRELRVASSCIALVAAFPATGMAQVLETITVTAQKREQSIQDVGITVTAVSAERLKEASVRDVVDLAAFSPNVQVNYGLGNNFFNIRGLGLNEFTANLDAPVAVHVDEVYQSKGFMTGLSTFDVERVEILKGPQGDLFGRNTTGGTVNFITGRPDYDLGARAIVNYGNFNTINAEGFITGQIANNLAGRLAAYVTNQGRGFYENQLTGEDEGRVREYALRGQLEWSSDKTTVLASLHYGEDNSELHPYEGSGNTDPETGALCAEFLNGTVEGDTPGCVRGLDLAFVDPDNLPEGIELPLPGLFQPGESDPFTTQNNLRFDVDNYSIGGFVRIDHDFGNHIFTSLTAFERFDRKQQEDSDGSPVPSVEVYWNNRIDQFTQEFRLTSDFDHDDWSYVAGLFYENDDYRNEDYLTAFIPFLPNPGNPLNNFSNYDQNTDAYAGFLHVEANLNEQLRLIAGIRYTNERVEVNGGTFRGDGLVEIDGVFQPETITGMIADAELAPGGNSRKDENVSYRLGAQYYPSDDVMIYANISTGFRSGGYSVAFAQTQEELVNLQPETITSYEIGIKSELLGGRLQVNAAAFRYDVQNGQVDVDVPGSPVPITVNAPESETFGAEIETKFAVTNEFQLLLGGGWTDTEIGSVEGIEVGELAVEDLGGNRRAFNPLWTLIGQARYAKDIGTDKRFIGSLDWNWRSSQFLEVNNQPSNEIDAYWVVNGRAALELSEGQYTLALWARNLTDTEYVTYLNDLPAFGWLLRGFAPPRTFGGSFEFNF
ncbi:MAG: TonB-dependent receptor [Sphingomonadales bacterium]